MPRINAGGSGVSAEGLNRLNRDLKAIGKDAQAELKKANVDVAHREAERAQRAAYSVGGVAAHVAPGITGGGGNAWAGIRLGSDPAAPGAEFGGQHRPTTMQFKPWRGSGPGSGYFLFPQIRRDNEEITRTWTESIEDLMKRHGL
jgi:hypothetical protein